MRPLPEPILGDEDDEDDDEDDEIVLPSGAPALGGEPPLSHAGPGPRTMLINRPVSSGPSAEGVARADGAGIAKEVVSDFRDILGALDIKAGSHKITVIRLKPEKGIYDDGEEINLKGQCGEAIEYKGIDSIPDADYIKEHFGGGIYELRVGGPNSAGKGWSIKTRQEIPIPGAPILPYRKKAPGSQDGVLKTVLEQNEKERVRLAKEAADARERNDRLLAEQSKRQETFMMTLMSPQKTAEQLQAERDERRADAEKAERLRREDSEKAERRHQEQLAAAKEAAALQMRQMELAQQARIEESKLAAAQADRQFQMQLQAQKEAAALQAQQANQQLQMQMKQMETQAAAQQAQMQQMQATSMQMMQQQQQAFAAQAAQQQAASQASSQLMMTMMNNANGEKGIFLERLLTQPKDTDFDSLIKAKQVIDMMSGRGDEDDRPGWERAMDKVLDNVDKIPKMLQAAKQLRPEAAAGATRKVLQPGTVAVAEIPERAVEQTPATTTAPTAPPATEAVKQPETITIDVTANDLTEFRGPNAAELEDAASSLKLLVQNIDLALQKELTVDQIFTSIVKQWPPEHIQLLAMQDAETVVSTIEERTPDTWKIVSPVGKRAMRELHALLVDA